MSLIDRSIDSVKLGRKNSIKLWVPDTGKSVYPTVYFQHGLGDDEQTPWTRSGLASYAEQHELIIVAADAEDSWFCNDPRSSTLWEDYFTYELPAYIEKEFPASCNGTGRGQCGFSMGGYGAMMLTLLHPDRFAAVSTHCGSFVFGHEYREDRPERAVLMKAAAPPGGNYDLFERVKNFLNSAAAAPAIRMDIGDDDYLIEQDRRFHACMNDNGIKHDYYEYPGSHQWQYVDQHLQESLEFFSKKLSI